MNSLSSPEIRETSSSGRYEALDAFRGLAVFGVVLLHTFDAAKINVLNTGGLTDELSTWLKLRDFSLPVIVMSSFFVLTVSTIRKPDSEFMSFFTKRLKRLWLPLFIWTNIYCLIWAYVMPKVFGLTYYEQLSSIAVLMSGYMHLWFLQFIFLGSLMVYPVLRWLKRKSELARIKISILCFLAAAIYGVLYELFIQPIVEQFVLQASINSMIFIKQSSKYIFFILIAIGVGLLITKINNLYKQRIFRICSLIAVLFSMILHLTTGYIGLTAAMYGIAVFAAALQPWKRIPFKIVYIAATYSYGIYILHYFLTEILAIFVVNTKIELNGAAILFITILFYIISFAAAILIRKIIPVDWLLPLVPINLDRSPKAG